MYDPELTQTKSSFKSISSKAGWLRGIERGGGPIVAALAENKIRTQGAAGCMEQPHPAQLCPRETVQQRCPGPEAGEGV